MKLIRGLILPILFLGNYCLADIYVVAHPDNPVEEMSLEQVRDLYLARSTAFPNGEFASVYDRTESEVRERFLNALAGLTSRRFDAFWARLVFAGRVLPLNNADNDEDMIQSIVSDTDALGYLTTKPDSEKAKTLLVINE